MSKKYKGKECVYCAETPSEGADHVFAKEFFLVKQRANLPKVPACSDCNNEKSGLETYLLGILPFGAKHRDGRAHLTQNVPPRLQRNRKLKNEIIKGRQTNWVKNQGGLIVPTLSLPFEPKNLTKLAKFWVKGLMWHHWDVLVPKDANLNILILTPHGEKMFQDQCFSLNPGNEIISNLGEGTVIYQGFQSTDNPLAAVWRFQVFGGLGFSRSRLPVAQSDGIIGCFVTGNKA